MHNSCLGISPKYLIFRNAPKPIIDLRGISFLCVNVETFTIFSAIVLKTCTYTRHYEDWKLFQNFRNITNVEKRKKKKTFYSDKLNESENDIKSTWKLLNMAIGTKSKTTNI